LWKSGSLETGLPCLWSVMSSRTRHRFFVPDLAPSASTATLPDDVSHQINHVLRLRGGDRIVLFCGDGYDFNAEIVESTRTSVRVEIVGEPFPGIVAGKPSIHLGQALLKSDRFDLVVQKTTELGVAQITAVENERSVVSLSADRAQSRRERWEKIAVEALEQSERSDSVSIQGPIDFGNFLERSASGLKLIAAERTDSPSLRDIDWTGIDQVTVLIGPEGGFSERELEQAANAGYQPVSLGPTILRSETAGIASVAMIRAITTHRA
jgi:16S rRNA (uracil1498-N3)-methyltransferase